MVTDWQDGSLTRHIGWASILFVGGAVGFALILAQASTYLAIDEAAADAFSGVGVSHTLGPENLVWSQFVERVEQARPDSVLRVDGRDGRSRYRIHVQSEFAVNDVQCWNFSMIQLTFPAPDSTDHIVCRSDRGHWFLPWVYPVARK